jgi:hypothetical protein
MGSNIFLGEIKGESANKIKLGAKAAIISRFRTPGMSE